MTTYNSYEAAKIANPDSDVFVNKDGVFRAIFKSTTSHFANGWKLCNPAGHCMTVEKFLADGYRFQIGDLFIGTGGSVIDVGIGGHLEEMHRSQRSDRYCYILRAAALEEKPKRTKVEYVKCEFSHAWEAVKEHEENKNIFHSIDRDGVIEEFAICGYDMHVIGECARDGELYRRIETPMTEQDCFIQDCRKSTMVQDDVVAMSLFEAGCRFVN